MKIQKILFVVNVDWFFLSHRLPIALAAKEAGYEVWVAAADSGQGEAISEHGFHFVPFPFSRKGTNLLFELGTLCKLYRLYRRIEPDLVHHVTIKPVLFGSIAARFIRSLHVVNAITGLGFTFTHDGKASSIGGMVRLLYRLALNNPRQRTIFQNPDDRDYFISNGYITDEHTVLIKGSGVDCTLYSPPEVKNEKPVVLFASRMIREKGVVEFYEAADIIRKRRPDITFILAGMSDVGTPNAIPAETLESWTREGVVQWIGHSDEMVELLRSSTILVLPTYYPEGVPKILIEAAACGLPIITTDRPGCREIVRHGINGILVQPRDVKHLAEAILLLIENPGLADKYGAAGRKIAMQEFSEEMVISKTIALYRELLPPDHSNSI